MFNCPFCGNEIENDGALSCPHCMEDLYCPFCGEMLEDPIYCYFCDWPNNEGCK